jgi:hypothetical protein
MTVVYTTQIEKELLEYCKKYIRISDCTPSQFIEELSSSLVQLIEHQAYEDLEYFKRIEIVTSPLKHS